MKPTLAIWISRSVVEAHFGGSENAILFLRSIQVNVRSGLSWLTNISH